MSGIETFRVKLQKHLDAIGPEKWRKTWEFWHSRATTLDVRAAAAFRNAMPELLAVLSALEEENKRLKDEAAQLRSRVQLGT